MAKVSKVWDYLLVLAWNIYIGTSDAAGRKSLSAMIKAEKPHVIAVMEATRQLGNLNGLGYQVFQLKPSPQRPGNIPNDANIALMVRNDVKVYKSFVHRMKTFWRGPKHGRAQDPRVYRSVKIKFAGRKVRFACAHTPFGEAARIESANFLVRWLKRGGKRTVDVLVLDSNMSRTEFDNTIGKPGGADDTYNYGVETIAVDNAEVYKKKNLGKGPSDHPAMLYTVKIEEQL